MNWNPVHAKTLFPRDLLKMVLVITSTRLKVASWRWSCAVFTPIKRTMQFCANTMIPRLAMRSAKSFLSPSMI